MAYRCPKCSNVLSIPTDATVIRCLSCQEVITLIRKPASQKLARAHDAPLPPPVLPSVAQVAAPPAPGQPSAVAPPPVVVHSVPVQPVPATVMESPTARRARQGVPVWMPAGFGIGAALTVGLFALMGVADRETPTPRPQPRKPVSPPQFQKPVLISPDHRDGGEWSRDNAYSSRTNEPARPPMEETRYEASKRNTGDELRKLEDKKEEVNKELEKLQKQMRDSQKQLNDLLSTLERMRRWQQPDVVLVNPAHFAVGLAITANGFELIAKGKDNEAQAALYIAEKHNVRHLHDTPELARRIYSQVEIGQPLPDALAAEIRALQGSTSDASAVKTEELQFISFRDPQSNARRLAVLKGLWQRAGADADREPPALEILGLNETSEALPRARIQSGTARCGNGREFIENLSDADLLDYCLLNVVSLLKNGRTDQDKFRPRLAIYVDVDSAATSSSSFVLNVLGLTIRHEASRPSNDQHNLSLMAKYMEDEVYAKLTKAGVSVLEREKIDLLVRELCLPQVLCCRLLQACGISPGESEIGDLAFAAALPRPEQLRLAGATHILNVEVKPALSFGVYHLGVRLIKKQNQQVLWAEQGDRKYACPTELYFPQSGRLARVQFNHRIPVNSQSTSSGRSSVPASHDLRGGTAISDGLVMVEYQGPDGLLYRPLFDKYVELATPDNVKSVVYVDDATQVRLVEQLRYITWRMAKSILPPAGVVIDRSSTGDAGNSAVVSIGTRMGIQKGDRLRLLRPASSPGQDTKSLLQPISVDLIVTQADSDRSSCFVRKCGIDDFLKKASTGVARTQQGTPFEDPRDDALRGDFAYRIASSLPVVNVQTLKFGGCVDQETEVLLRWANPARQQRLYSAADDVTRNLRRSIMDDLRNLGVLIVSADHQKKDGAPSSPSPFSLGTSLISQSHAPPPPNIGVSHEICGTVSIAGEERFRFDLFVKRPNSGEIVERLTMTMSKR